MPSATLAPSLTLSVGGAASLGASAVSFTVTLIVVCDDCVVCGLPASVSVAVTVRVMLWVDSPVVRVSPVSWAAARLQLPSGLRVPADSVASDGTPVILIVGACWSLSTAEALMPSATLAPSLTLSVGGAASLGASAVSFTVTLIVVCDDCVVCGLPASVSVAVTVRVMLWVDSPVVRVSPVSWAAARLQLPSGLRVPADSVASDGTPVILIVGACWSLSTAEAVMPSATLAPSLTLSVGGAARLGASAVSFTVTLMVVCDDCIVCGLPASVSVAVTVRVMLWVDSPVVRVSPVSWAAARLQLPSGLRVPADSVASDGTPVILIVGACWSLSTAEAVMPSATLAPSLTLSVGGAARLGASAVSFTVTLMVVCDDCVVCGLPASVSVAVTVRVMLWVDSPVVRVSPVSWAAARLQLPSGLRVPADSVASDGTPVILIVGACWSLATAEAVMPSATLAPSLTLSVGGAARL